MEAGASLRRVSHWRGPRPLSPPGFQHAGRSLSTSPRAAMAAVHKEDSARQAELTLLRLADHTPEPEPEPELQPGQPRMAGATSDTPAAVRKEMIVGPPAGSRKAHRKRRRKKRGRRGRRKAPQLPRIEGAFLGSVVVDDNPEQRLLARRAQRKAIEAKRPWRQPMPPMTKPSPGATLKVGSTRGGFGSGAVRKVVLPVPRPPPSSQPQRLPPPRNVRQKPVAPTPPIVHRMTPKRYQHVDHGLPYMQNIRRRMTARKLFAKLKELNTLARQHFADSNIHVINARDAARAATETIGRLEVSLGQRQTEVEAAQEELARQEDLSRRAQDRLASEVAEAEAVEENLSREVQEAKDAEARLAIVEQQAYAAAAEALKETKRAAEAQAAAAEAADKAAEHEEQASAEQAEQAAAEQAVAKAEHLVERGVNAVTGKKLKKQERLEAAADLSVKREHLLQRAPSARISDDRTKRNEEKLRQAKNELNSANSKKQRKALALTVARVQAALQQDRSEGVARALERATMSRAVAQEARDKMELVLQAADVAQMAADQKAAAASSARELAQTHLDETRAAQAAAAVERQEAEAAALAAEVEAEDVTHARTILERKVALHAQDQQGMAAARAEALRLGQLAEDIAVKCSANPSHSSGGHGPDDSRSETVDSKSGYEANSDDNRPVTEMRSFVSSILDEKMEQLCLPEDNPIEFARIEAPLRCCLDKCQEAIDLLGFDASVQHPAWSHQVDNARTEFKQLRTLCERKMVNGLLILAYQQLNERHRDSTEFKECFSTCEAALALCGSEHDETAESVGENAALSQSQLELQRLRCFRERRRNQIEDCRKLAQTKCRAVELREIGRERLRQKDARAVLSLAEAVLLDPDDEETARLHDQARTFVDEKKRVADEKASIEQQQANVASMESMEQAKVAAGASASAAAGALAGPAGTTLACSAAEQAYNVATETGIDIGAASQGATADGEAATQAISGGRADAVGVAGQQAAEQLLQTMAPEQHEKSTAEWQEQKNDSTIEAISEYKHQVATLSEELRKQAEDAKQTVKMVVQVTAQVKQLQAEAEKRAVAFEEERSALQTQIECGHQEITRLQQELQGARDTAEAFLGKDEAEATSRQEGILHAHSEARKRLEALKVVTLHKKVVSAGFDVEEIEATMATEDPKTLLVEMLMMRQRQQAEAAFLQALSQ